MKKLLLIAPHVDDIEISAGGTIVKWQREKKYEMYYAVFSYAHESNPGFNMERENLRALEALGHFTDIIAYNYEVRWFPDYRQKILEDLVQIRKEIDPDLVIAPSTDSWHQDHLTVATEAQRAFRDRNMLLYKHPWDCKGPYYVNYFVPILGGDLGKKVFALTYYESQMEKRDYMNPDYIETMARWNGVLCGVEFAEGFEVFKLTEEEEEVV
jgi:LmbE family N-acetylglucosaminyl deacetylase